MILVNEEGLFRKSGTCSNIQQLKTEIDLSGELSFETLQTVLDCHDISGLLKQFIRELPSPLVPAEIYDELFAGVSHFIFQLRWVFSKLIFDS